jgi:hypothetical protein
MQTKKTFLIGFAALAITASGAGYSSDAAKVEAKDAQEEAVGAQQFADEKQAEAQAAVKAHSKDAGAKLDEAAAAEDIAAKRQEEAAKAGAAIPK